MAFLPSWRQTHEDGQLLASAVCLVVAFLHLPRGCWAAWRCPQTWRIQSPIPWQLIRRQKINNRLHTTTIFKLWENGLSNHCCCIIRLKILKIQIMIFLCFDFILAALPTGPSTAQFNILHDNKNLTRLSPAASPVRNSLNGGNCLNRSSTGRDSHGGPCHKSLISLSREIKLKKTE